MFTGLIIKESLKPDTMLVEMGLKIVRTEKWNDGERAAEFHQISGVLYSLKVKKERLT